MDVAHSNESQAESGIPIRSRLLLLTVAGILPLAVMSGIALLVLAGKQREQVEQAGLEIARALSTAVDVEIAHSVSALEALASTLELLDDAGFEDAGRRLLAIKPQWAALVVHDPDGWTKLHAGGAPDGDPFAPLAPETLELMRERRRPFVGSLTGPMSTELTFPVKVPVVRAERLAYVLSAKVKPNGMLDVLERQRLPTDWVVSVFDPAGLRVARSRQHEAHVGGPPSPSLAGLMGQGPSEGTGVSQTLENERVHTAYSRSASTGFTVAIGMPSSFVDAGAIRSLVTYGGGLLLSALLGVLAALAVARSVILPIGKLRLAARALGRREPVVAPPTSILELRQVGESLALAAAEHARNEVERERLLRREQEARAFAEAANRSKDEFLAMLGHELRNPLGAIANASALLDDPRVDAATLENAKQVVARQVAHMARLTDDLLDAARALTGKIVLRREPMDLAAATAQVLVAARTGEKVAQRNIVESLEPVWIDADPTRIEQIVGNLLGNAVKYSHEGGTISVTVRGDGEQAELCVADDGFGMGPELVERVFEPFVQGDRDLDRRHGGLGIGLTMVRRLVELHGGSVRAHSDGPGLGSEFYVRLPATKAPAPTPSLPPAFAPSPSVGRSILLVEDNDDARDSLRRLLELGGHRVIAASDGASALGHLQATPSEVALIDIGLPGMDGYELARQIRAAVGSSTLLVALTGYGLPADRSRTQAAGFDLHLVKPVDREKLEEVLRRS